MTSLAGSKILRLIVLLAFGGFALWMALSAAVGVVHQYTPSPFWDMWRCGVNFYLKFSGGDLASLWAQHNEHRIVLTKLLTLVDYRFFGGLNVFLAVANYLIVCLEAALFWALLVDSVGGGLDGWDRALGFFITGWLFAWWQWENFALAYGSQDFLVQLLPLASLFALHRAAVKGWRGPFWVAVALGVASIGTMANGVLTLPVLAVCAWVLGAPRSRLTVLLGLSLAGFAVYFYGWIPSPGHGDFLAGLAQPASLARFLLTFLGSPFYYVFHQINGLPVDAVMAVASGLGCLALVAILGFTALHESKRPTLDIALLAYVAFFLATTVVTAAGRFKADPMMRPASRYTTSAMLPWAAILVLVNRRWKVAGRPAKGAWAAGFLLLAALVARTQREAWSKDDGHLANYKVADVAASLQIKDLSALGQVSDDPAMAMALADEARRRKVAIFGHAPYRDAPAELGTPVPIPTRQAEGILLRDGSFSQDGRFWRVRGWIVAAGRVPAYVLFLDSDGKLAGFGATGTAWDGTVGRGFGGYVLAAVARGGLTVVGVSPGCAFKAGRI